MARNTLTVAQLKAVKPGAKPYRLFDGGGLYLEVMPNGGMYWRQKYRFAKREKRLAHGVYPDVTLAEARAERDKALATLKAGQDPGEVKRANKRNADAAAGNTFKAVADEWMASRSPAKEGLSSTTTTGAAKGPGRSKAAKGARLFAPKTKAKASRIFTHWLYPHIGHRPVNEIEPPELLSALRRIEAAGHHDTAHRALGRCRQVFQLAIASGRAVRNPANDLAGILTPSEHQHYAALTGPVEVGKLLCAIEVYHGSDTVRDALRLAPYLFSRPGNLRSMKWAELDLEGGEWRIPADKMKMKDEHVIPLASQVVAILAERKRLSCGSQFVFPGRSSKNKHLSETAMNQAMRRMGFDKDAMTSHGFRTTASTRLNELGFDWNWVERQLAHKDRNKSRGTYNKAMHLPERKRMMQAWADEIDRMRVGSTVTPIRAKARATGA